MKFRNKPVVIEAVRWDGKFATIPLIDALAGKPVPCVGSTLKIETLEGVMSALIGDWIIKGIKGELYPCKPDIFAATYEKVEE